MRIPVLLSSLMLAGCATADVAGPDSAGRGAGHPALAEATGAAQVTAFAQNVYVGTNIDLVLPALLTPDPTDDLPALRQAAAVLAQTDFSFRVAGIATEIARTRPHAIGLNEISAIDVDLRPLGENILVHEDFLAELIDTLAARHLNYTVAATVQGLVASPPLPFGAVVNIIDRDVLLVDADRVTVAPGTVTKNFTDNVGPIATGVILVRGFVVVPAAIEGRLYHIAVTHLESNLAGFPPFDLLRGKQMLELVGYLPAGTPAIVMGDLNDVPGSPMHQVALAAGFADVWAAFHPLLSGFTCCNDDDLANGFPTHDQRLDYVLARGLDSPAGRLAGNVDRYGATRSDIIPGPDYPLWPSDHAGLVAKLVVPAAVLP